MRKIYLIKTSNALEVPSPIVNREATLVERPLEMGNWVHPLPWRMSRGNGVKALVYPKLYQKHRHMTNKTWNIEGRIKKE